VFTDSNEDFQVKGHELDRNYGPYLADTSARIDWGFAQSTVLVGVNVNAASVLAEAYRCACVTMFPQNTAMTLHEKGTLSYGAVLIGLETREPKNVTGVQCSQLSCEGDEVPSSAICSVSASLRSLES
jgi:hypothetical protein